MKRVLIIDDDHSVGTAIQLLLARDGHDAVLARDAMAGLQAFESSIFDLVMVDIFMPEIDGLEAIKRFREQAPAMPIVAMSGFRFRNSTSGAPDYLAMAAKLGATTCLRKPFHAGQLTAAIKLSFDQAYPSDDSTQTQRFEQGTSP